MAGYKFLQEEAYAHIREQIVTGVLQEDQIYSETKLAAMIGISRTPVKDALVRLSQEKLIDILPSRGFRLHQMSEEDIWSTYQLRTAVEGFCVLHLAHRKDTPEGKECLGQLADSVLHNPDAAPSIRAMAPAVLLVCLVSAYRGYCQGYGNMIPTTVGQVLEVLAKVIVGLILAYVIMKAGMGKPLASAGAIFGVTTGSLAALVYMFIYKRKNYRDEELDTPDTPDSTGKILSRFLRIGVPIALGTSALSLLNLVDSSLCMDRLQSAAGFAYQDAKTLYGVYGKAQTLFNLPAAFITPLTISVVPAIASAIARGENDNATQISEDSMRVSAVLAMPMGVGLAVLSYPIMRVIYPDSHSAGPVLLAIMGIASIFVCVVLMENAVLQASGKEKLPMYTMLVGGVVKIAVNWFLVANPRINIYGAPIGTLVSYLVMFIINFVFMCFALDKNPRLSRILIRPGVSSVLMGAAAWGVYGLTARFIGAGSWSRMALCMLVAVAAAVIVYFVSVIALRGITREDMKLIPGGEKVAKILHMR